VFITSYTKVDRKVHAAYNPSDHEYGLFPRPLHIGKYLMERRVDFQLPFDVWLLHNTGLVSERACCTMIGRFIIACCHLEA
jgi:hypothetical protein